MNNIYLTHFLGHFIGSYKIDSFPILNWFFVLVVGLIFGNYLIRCIDKNKFYKKILTSTLLISLILIINGLITKQDVFSTTESKISITLFLVSVFYFLLPFIPRKLEQVIKFISGNITNIYITHLLLILLWINPLNEFLQIKPNPIFCVLTILGLIIISILLSKCMLNISKRYY